MSACSVGKSYWKGRDGAIGLRFAVAAVRGAKCRGVERDIGAKPAVQDELVDSPLGVRGV